jgi:hypothetical protein
MKQLTIRLKQIRRYIRKRKGRIQLVNKHQQHYHINPKRARQVRKSMYKDDDDYEQLNNYGKKMQKILDARYQSGNPVDRFSTEITLNMTEKDYQQERAKRLAKRKTRIIDSPKFKSSCMTPKEFKMYREIVAKARKKGYKIPKVDLVHGPLVIDEINIPETYGTEGIFLPDNDLTDNKEVAMILIDDDAPTKVKRVTFAHELGHVHMDSTREHDTEAKADKIAAKILDISESEVRSSDKYKDVYTLAKRKK